LPIVNRVLGRMRLEEVLLAYLPEDDPRTKIPTAKGLIVLLKNLLFSREPLYGLGEWASRYAPDLLGLSPEEMEGLNDDRVGRCLDRLFEADGPSFVLALVTHVVREFDVRLDALHNDSTTVTFFGAYRLLWYHSTRKAEMDALARSGRIERALKQLAMLREKLRSPRTRYRQQAKVAAAVEEVLRDAGAEHWIAVTVQEHAVESYHQEHRGRAGKDTRYIKKIATRFDLEYRIDDARVAEEARGDGLFPLVSNVLDLSEQEILWSYKRQPTIEKRFSQLKTDYEVAPVYLKEVRRIQALLCLYFLALLVEALVERELRQTMKRETTESLPLYPEGRPCRCPTTRRLLDVFDLVQRHTLQGHDGHTEVLVTELTDLQRKLLKLLGIPSNDYGR